MKNEYSYLLDDPQEEVDDLVESVYNITELFENNKIEENGKKNFYSVMKKIIRRSDFRSYSCVNLLRDIMTDEMFDFLLEELKKDVLINEPLSIEIMKRKLKCLSFPNLNRKSRDSTEIEIEWN